MTDVDEAAPAQAAESSSPAPAAAPPATAWFYLDDTGAERGPFSTADMTSWHAAGYFTGETKVRSAKEDTCKPLSERPKDAETFVPASSATAAADAPVESVAKSSAIEDEFEVDMYDDNGDDAEGGEDDEEGEDDQKDEDEKAGEDGDTEMKDSSSDAKQPVIPPEKLPWFYTDKDSIIRGPFSPVTMLKWHRAGFFAYNKTKLRRQDEEEAKTLEERTTAPSFYLAASLLPRLVLEDRWYYLDSKDAEHGPFTGGQMRAWYEGGFLKKDLRVRQLGEKEGDWRTMEQKQCEWMKPLPPKPVVAAPPQPMQQPYGYNPNPYAPPPAAFGQHPPPAGPYGHAHSPYPSPYAHPAPPPPPRQPRADYAQTLALQGRGARHAVNAAFVDPFSGVPPADPSLRQMNHFMNTSELDRWQEEQTRRQQERQQQGAGGGGRGGYHQQQGYRGGRR